MFSRPGFALRSLIHECDTAQVEHLHGVIIEGVVDPAIELLREVVNRGIERVEVCPDAANGYVFYAVLAVMMYCFKVCVSERNERDIEEMMAQFMLPLLRPAGA